MRAIFIDILLLPLPLVFACFYIMPLL